MRTKSDTYARITRQNFWRFSNTFFEVDKKGYGSYNKVKTFPYTKKEEKKICSYFPIKNRGPALKETKSCVLKMVSWLCSDTPLNIKRNEYNQQKQSLRKAFVSLEKQLDCIQKKNNYLWNELAAKFNICYKANLGDFEEMVITFKTICDTIKLPREKGRQNEAKYQAFECLVKIWEEYNNKKATRTVDPDAGTIDSKCYDYIYDSIKLFIIHVNKILKKRGAREILLKKIGFENTYRETLKSLNSRNNVPMVKTHPK